MLIKALYLKNNTNTHNWESSSSTKPSKVHKNENQLTSQQNKQIDNVAVQETQLAHNQHRDKTVESDCKTAEIHDLKQKQVQWNKKKKYLPFK